MDHSTSDDSTLLSKTRLSDAVRSGDSFPYSRSTAQDTSEFMEPSRSSRTKNNARVQGVQERRVNKLRYDSIELVGREVESEILHSRLRRVATSGKGPQ